MNIELLTSVSSLTRTFRTAVLLLTAFLCMPLPSISQEKDKSSSEKKRALTFIVTAADITRKMHPQSLVGYVAVYVDQSNWTPLIRDSDLGPFLKFKEQRTERSAVIFISGLKDFVFCTYFDGSVPFGTVALPPPGKTGIAQPQIEESYRSVSADMLQDNYGELSFDEGMVTTDDGKPIPSFRITKEGQKTQK